MLHDDSIFVLAAVLLAFSATLLAGQRAEACSVVGYRPFPGPLGALFAVVGLVGIARLKTSRKRA